MLRTARPDAEVPDTQNPRPVIVDAFCRRKPAIASRPSPRLSPPVGATRFVIVRARNTRPGPSHAVATERTVSLPAPVGPVHRFGRHGGSFAVRRPALATARTVPRWPRADGRGCARAAPAFLLRCGQWRRLGDARRRPHLATDLRRCTGR